MVIYNVTSRIESSIEKKWLVWMKEKHIPEKLITKSYKAAKIFKIISENDKGGISYVTQYHCDDKKSLQQYINDYGAKLRNDTLNKFGDLILPFRTELELIEKHP